jgi:hypothetical protein
MPQTPGEYEFRFFQNNSWTLLATSPAVTVAYPTTPVLEVLPSSLSFGAVSTGASAEQSVTVRNAGAGTLVGEATVTGAGFALAGQVGTQSYSLGAGQTAAITVRFQPVVLGAASGTLGLTGAGGASVPLSGIGEPPPTTPILEVEPQSLAFGSVGVGASADRVLTVRNAGAGTLTGQAVVAGTGFSLVSASSYSLDSGETAALTVRFAPIQAGDESGSLTLTGADGAVVPLSGSGIMVPTVTVGPTSVPLGGTVQVTVAGGPGNRGDWVGLSKVGSASTSTPLDWKYLSGTRTQPATGLASAVLTFTMPLTPGGYEFRFFKNSSYTLLATSPAVTVMPPTLTVSAATAAPGSPIQVTVADGPGYRGDWVVLAKVGTAVTSTPLDWKYMNGTRSQPATGLTSAVLTFTMPQTPGEYEFRFFQNNSWTLLATSPSVLVGPTD